MEFKRHSPLVTRISILVATIVVFAFVVAADNRSYMLILALLVAIIFQVKKLLNEVEGKDVPLSSFFDSIRFDEITQTFKADNNSVTVQKLQRELNEALSKLKQARKEKDSEYQFFKNIVQHVGIGLLTFKRDGSIQIMNSAAKRVLRVTKADRVEDLKVVSESLVDTFLKLKTGGRELLQLKFGDETVQLSVFAIELTLRDEEVKLISMSNIQSELEEKEMEAWQN
ncbi:MAG: ATP-binding protein, partial [Cyclobacteriaceae bacterium]